MSVVPKQERLVDHADQASENIHHAFSFARRVLRRLEILDELPDRAMLNGREIDHRGHVFELVAARAEGSEEWVARPIHYSPTLGAPYLERPMAVDPVHGTGPLAQTRAFSAEAATAAAAFDALAARLRAAVDAALAAETDAPASDPSAPRY